MTSIDLSAAHDVCRDRPRYVLGRAAAALAIFAALMASTTPSPLYPIYLDRWDLGQSVGTAIYATYALGTLMALFLSGWLNHRVSDRRKILLPALALTATGAVLFACAEGVGVLFLGRLLSGISTGLITGTASAAIYDLSPDHRKSRAAMISTVAFTAGAATGPCIAASAVALQLAPLVLPFLLIAAIAALAAVGLVLAAWPHLKGTPRATTEPRAIRFADQIDDRLRRRLFLVSCLAIASAWSLGSVLMALSVTLATDLFHVTLILLAGMSPALFQLVGGLSQVVASWVRPTTAIMTGFAGIALVGVLMGVGAHAGTPVVFLLAIILSGVAYGAAFVGGAALVNETSPEGTLAGRVSRFYVVGYLSNALPTLAMGIAIDRIGLEPTFLGFCVTLVALCALGLVLDVKRRGEINRILA